MSLGEDSQHNENQGAGNTDKGFEGRMVFYLTGLKGGIEKEVPKFQVTKRPGRNST